MFFEVNKKALEISKKTKDLYAIGDSYWNYATFYVKKEIDGKAYDNFNKAFNHFIKSGHKQEAVKVLWGMTRIKGRYNDFAGSEKLNIQAIKLAKNINDYSSLHLLYNHLGLLHKEIKEYEKSLGYFQTAMSYFEKIPEKLKAKNYIEIYNNIGNLYRQKKEYGKALKFYYRELKKENLKISQITRIQDNISYCRLKLNDTSNVKKIFFRSLKVRDSLNNKTGVVTSKINISDYYSYLKDTVKALKYAKEANSLAKQIKHGGTYLVTLNQLSNLDPKNSKKHLNRYIKFNDSLISTERKMQNKFTRIEFETDEYIAETKRLNQQRIWIIFTSLGGLLILSLLYFLRVQKVRNEKLRLEAEHQKANEEVYILTLKQQAKLEEERVNERNRISAELHDGILGKLFGTRVNLGFLAMGMQPDTQTKHQQFLDELQDIEKEIRDVSHKLSDNFDDSNINFISIIEQLLKDKSIIGSFKYQFNNDKNIKWKSINEITKANLYRIIQEILQNIIKHAKAKNVILDVQFQKNKLVVVLNDDGIGFNTKQKKKGIGLKNIQLRIEKIKGQLLLNSKENEGTTFKIIIPL